MGHDTIGKLLESKQNQEHQQALLAEEIEQYRLSLNRIFSSPDGKLFLKKIVKYCGINTFDTQLNPAKLIEDAGKRKVYLELIRPYLDKTILMELEQ